MKVTRYKAKTYEGKEVCGYYWKETNNACFAEEYKETHYIREQINWDWNLYTLCDYVINPSTLEIDREEEIIYEEK